MILWHIYALRMHCWLPVLDSIHKEPVIPSFYVLFGVGGGRRLFVCSFVRQVKCFCAEWTELRCWNTPCLINFWSHWIHVVLWPVIRRAVSTNFQTNRWSDYTSRMVNSVRNSASLWSHSSEFLPLAIRAVYITAGSQDLRSLDHVFAPYWVVLVVSLYMGQYNVMSIATAGAGTRDHNGILTCYPVGNSSVVLITLNMMNCYLGCYSTEEEHNYNGATLHVAYPMLSITLLFMSSCRVKSPGISWHDIDQIGPNIPSLTTEELSRHFKVVCIFDWYIEMNYVSLVSYY